MVESLQGKVLKIWDHAKYSEFQSKYRKVLSSEIYDIAKVKKNMFHCRQFSCKQIMEIINEKCNFLAILETVLWAELATNFST